MTKARTMDSPMVLTIASNLMYFLVSSCTKPHADQCFGGLPNPSIFLKNLGCVKDHIPLTRPKPKVNIFLSLNLDKESTGNGLDFRCKGIKISHFVSNSNLIDPWSFEMVAELTA